ncbi:hypothetical protein Mal64_35920 [Pseudobythopirellula maris]|uniref:Protease PrsW n=1 Tax=Pseudobythopirellula maris TaxID=2527991 RepID=A0A5C5ZHD0_9BACT|nr:PrsW family glutamic-type intramembrane protease [Pseudobythopirellula maris]TWT86762.1 hypothetical protein Mal64_35920 [Pseudobythopirellula maris]
MGKRTHDEVHSVYDEPHLSDRFGFGSGPNAQGNDELKAERLIRRERESAPEDEAVEHTVWDEPALAGAEAPTNDEFTYSRWLERRIAETSLAKSCWATLLVALAAGPWGVIGALTSGMTGAAGSWSNLLAVALVAPVTEEITKLAVALWVVEKKPYLFKSMGQIVLCAFAGGAMFAVIENLIYIFVYVPEGNDAFRAWRWTVCTALHVGCSFIAGVGLIRIWDQTMRTRRRPELAHGMPFFAMAMIGHGLYNVGVTVAEAGGWLSFD